MLSMNWVIVIFTVMEVPKITLKLLNGSEQQQNVDIQRHRLSWEFVIKKVKELNKTSLKLLNGSNYQQNKAMLMHNVCWVTFM